MRHFSRAGIAALALCGGMGAAQAGNFSFTGSLSNDNQVQYATFTLSAPTTVQLRSYSYGGGTNAQGATIAAGGFDIILTVFNETTGAYINGNDDGGSQVATDPVTGLHYDSYLSLDLPAGTYRVAVSQYSSFSAGANLSNGFNGTFLGNFNGRTAAWAFDVLNGDSATLGGTYQATPTVHAPAGSGGYSIYVPPGTDLPPPPAPTGPISLPNVDTAGSAVQPVTAVTQVLSANTGNVSINHYVVEVTGTTTLTMATTALEGAAVRLATTQPVTLVSGASTVTLQASGASQPVFQVATVEGTRTLVPVAGEFGMTATAAGATLPLVGGSAGSAVLQAASGGARIEASVGSGTDARLTAALTSGQAEFRHATRSRAVPATLTVYAGEALAAARDDGGLESLRLGSLKQNAGLPGDYLGGIALAADGLNVPIVTGTAGRFSDALNLVVGRALASLAGIAAASVTGLTQDAATGVLTLATTAGSFRYLPVGELQIDLERLRALSAADIAANLELVVAEGLRFAVAPATSTDDLAAALRDIDPQAALTVAADGVVRVKLNNYDYALQPSPTVTGTNLTPGAASLTEESNGTLRLRDSAGRVQTLYGAFADLGAVKSAFTPSDANFSIANQRNGTYRATFSGTSYTLSPALRVIWPWPARTENWWQDGNRLFVRYPSGMAQEFAVR